MKRATTLALLALAGCNQAQAGDNIADRELQNYPKGRYQMQATGHDNDGVYVLDTRYGSVRRCRADDQTGEMVCSVASGIHNP